MNLVDILISSVGSAALLGAVVWLSKNWIKTRLENAIKHEYSVKLESHNK